MKGTTMPSKSKTTKPTSVNGAAHPDEEPVDHVRTESTTKKTLNAPWTGDEMVSFADLASPRHLKVKQQLEGEKPKVIEVRRPGKQEFIRVKPAPEGRVPIALIQDERKRGTWYAVVPDLLDEF